MLNGKKAKEEDRLFFRWCLLEVHNYGEPINFKEYRDKMTWKPQPSTQKILADQEKYIALFKQGMERVDF